MKNVEKRTNSGVPSDVTSGGRGRNIRRHLFLIITFVFISFSLCNSLEFNEKEYEKQFKKWDISFNGCSNDNNGQAINIKKIIGSRDFKFEYFLIKGEDKQSQDPRYPNGLLVYNALKIFKGVAKFDDTKEKQFAYDDCPIVKRFQVDEYKYQDDSVTIIFRISVFWDKMEISGTDYVSHFGYKLKITSDCIMRRQAIFYFDPNIRKMFIQ